MRAVSASVQGGATLPSVPWRSKSRSQWLPGRPWRSRTRYWEIPEGDRLLPSPGCTFGLGGAVVKRTPWGACRAGSRCSRAQAGGGGAMEK